MTSRARQLLLSLLGISAASWLWQPIRHENDIWWHLASGRDILQNHRILRTDVFSSTAFGHPWINHEWLYQVLAYLFFYGGGISGIQLMRISLIFLAFGLIIHHLQKKKVPLSVQWIVLVISFWASRFAWNDRADLISILFSTALAHHLATVRSDPFKGRSLWLWPFLFAIWANMHGGFILGLAIVVGFFLGLALERQASLPLGLWACACAGATLLNPWGYKLHRSMFEGVELLRSGFIREWMRTPWRPMQLFWLSLAAHWALFAKVSWQRRRVDWPVLFIHFILSWSAIRYVRNVPYFMLGAFPAVGEWVSQKAASTRGFVLAAAAATLLFTAYAVPHMKNGVDPLWQPVEACAFIRNAQIPGRFYNDYAFGGYWMWCFGTTRPVFIDGRLHTVDGYVTLYHHIETAQTGMPQEWDSFLRSYGVNAALVSYPDASPLPSAFDLYFPRKDWALIYWDDTALIFIRRTAANQPWIRAYEFRYISPDAKPDLERSRMHQSKVFSRRVLEDLERNEHLHPGSRRVEFWRSVLPS